MTISYDQTTQTSRMQATLNAFDGSAQPATIEIGTQNLATVLVTIPLAKPSFTLSLSTLTMAGTPRQANATNGGVMLSARIKDGAGNIRASGLTVGVLDPGTGLPTTDIVLTTTTAVVGAPVTINSGTIIHSP